MAGTACVGKMKLNKSCQCELIPARLRWSYLGSSGLSISHYSQYIHIIMTNPLLAKLVGQRCGILTSFFFLWTLASARSIHTPKKELCQYPAILTSLSSKNPYFINQESNQSQSFIASSALFVFMRLIVTRLSLILCWLYSTLSRSALEIRLHIR